MKILIVEDDPNIGYLLKRYLEPLATHVDNAYTMAEAREKLKEARSFDIVTLDLSLPDSHREQTLAEIQNLRKADPDMLVIIISGTLSMADAEIAFRAGADGFMSKQVVSLHSRSFLTTLREIVDAVLHTPRHYSRNVNLLESVAAKISEQLASQS